MQFPFRQTRHVSPKHELLNWSISNLFEHFTQIMRDVSVLLRNTRILQVNWQVFHPYIVSGWRVRRFPISVGAAMISFLQFLSLLWAEIPFSFVDLMSLKTLFSFKSDWLKCYFLNFRRNVHYPHWLKGLTLRCSPYSSCPIRPISRMLISHFGSGVPGLFLMNVGLIGVKVGFKATVGWSKKRRTGLI